VIALALFPDITMAVMLHLYTVWTCWSCQVVSPHLNSDYQINARVIYQQDNSLQDY